MECIAEQLQMFISHLLNELFDNYIISYIFCYYAILRFSSNLIPLNISAIFFYKKIAS